MKELKIRLQVPGSLIIYIIGTKEEVYEWFCKKIDGLKNKKQKRITVDERERFKNRYFNSEKRSMGATRNLGNSGAFLIWINTDSAKTKRRQLSTVVHENRHLSDHLEERYGIHDTEFYAYLENYLYDELEKLLTNKKEEQK